MTQLFFGSYRGELRKMRLFEKKTVILIKIRDDATYIKMTNYQHTHRVLQFITP